VDVLTLVDTGFDGFLAIPDKFAQSLGLLPTFKKEVILANGENYFVGGIDLSVEMDDLGFKEKVEVLFIQGEKALFGLSLLSLICLDLNRDLILSFNDCKIRFD
jgi:predicted aspartyl protease